MLFERVLLEMVLLLLAYLTCLAAAVVWIQSLAERKSEIEVIATSIRNTKEQRGKDQRSKAKKRERRKKEHLPLSAVAIGFSSLQSSNQCSSRTHDVMTSSTAAAAAAAGDSSSVAGAAAYEVDSSATAAPVVSMQAAAASDASVKASAAASPSTTAAAAAAPVASPKVAVAVNAERGSFAAAATSRAASTKELDQASATVRAKHPHTLDSLTQIRSSSSLRSLVKSSGWSWELSEGSGSTCISSTYV
jgi:hypothetical protein